MMPKIAASAKVYIDGKIRRLFIDGEEFPYYTNGINYERVTGEQLGYLTIRVPVERYQEAAPEGLTIQTPAAPPPGREPAGTLHRDDVLGLPKADEPE